MILQTPTPPTVGDVIRHKVAANILSRLPTPQDPQTSICVVPKLPEDCNQSDYYLEVKPADGELPYIFYTSFMRPDTFWETCRSFSQGSICETVKA